MNFEQSFRYVDATRYVQSYEAGPGAASTTDPDARLYRKGKGKETKLCFMGHGLMENLTASWSMPALPRPAGMPNGLRPRI
jgi:hypothetical protein